MLLWLGQQEADSDSLFKKLTSATHSCRMANENIRKICYGAAVYLDVVWATRMFHAVIRLRQSGCAWQNKAATCVGLLRRWLGTTVVNAFARRFRNSSLFLLLCITSVSSGDRSSSSIGCAAKDTKHISCWRNFLNSSSLASLMGWTGRLRV